MARRWRGGRRRRRRPRSGSPTNFIRLFSLRFSRSPFALRVRGPYRSRAHVCVAHRLINTKTSEAEATAAAVVVATTAVVVVAAAVAVAAVSRGGRGPRQRSRGVKRAHPFHPCPAATPSTRSTRATRTGSGGGVTSHRRDRIHGLKYNHLMRSRNRPPARPSVRPSVVPRWRSVAPRPPRKRKSR